MTTSGRLPRDPSAALGHAPPRRRQEQSHHRWAPALFRRMTNASVPNTVSSTSWHAVFAGHGGLEEATSSESQVRVCEASIATTIDRSREMTSHLALCSGPSVAPAPVVDEARRSRVTPFQPADINTHRLPGDPRAGQRWIERSLAGHEPPLAVVKFLALRAVMTEGMSARTRRAHGRLPPGGLATPRRPRGRRSDSTTVSSPAATASNRGGARRDCPFASKRGGSAKPRAPI